MPASSIGVQKYVGVTKLDETSEDRWALWTRQKQAVEKAVADMAADMRIQAVQAKQPGRAFHDTPWQKHLNNLFSSTPLPIKQPR